jgi:hypothetical protein
LRKADQALRDARSYDRAHERYRCAFARFLEVLAASLDDHNASGDALASRVHLSRFHFDRLVSAAAGEPPAHCAGGWCSSGPPGPRQRRSHALGRFLVA